MTPRNRRPGTDDATRVRMISGDDELAAALLPGLDDSSGPARRLSQAKASSMVASIVAAALEDAPAQRTESTAPVPRTSAPRRLAPILAVALVAAAVVGAAAAVVTTRYFTPARVREEVPPPPPHNVPAPVLPKDEPEELVIDDGTVITEQAPTRPRKDRDKDDRPEPKPTEKIDLPPDAPAEDILALANQRRKERAWKAADELYRRVLKQYPRTDAAIVAEVASATLHLEHLGDATGALAGYRRALAARPAGALGEEARWGIAEAFRAVGDTKGEAFALRVFLDTHPRSAMAPAARRRLAELSP
ncbi:MAG TPA: hypothetical protein VM261_22050 [Kofleriaceae bacterium]|nr:hypothetical protein [Kofleriaceae bacterium]